RIAVAIILGVGVLKLMVALAAGRGNIILLLTMMIFAPYFVRRGLNPYRTRVGDDFLASLRSMFTGLRQRRASLQPGSGSREVLWLSALFGVALLPAEAFPFIRDFRERYSLEVRSGGCGGGGGCASGSGGGGGGGGCGCGGGGGGGC